MAARVIRTLVIRTLLVVVAATLLAACATSRTPVVTPPRETASPAPTVSVAVDQTRRQIADALGAARYQLLVPTVPFRPPEPASFAAVPRGVFQVVLPTDPTHGYVVIYEFLDTSQASVKGQEMARHLGGGPGKVQFTPDTEHVLRQVGTTVILYSWSEATSPGPDVQAIAKVLEGIGQAIAIPR